MCLKLQVRLSLVVFLVGHNNQQLLVFLAECLSCIQMFPQNVENKSMRKKDTQQTKKKKQQTP